MMTTEQKIRRRQYRLGIFVMILAIFSAGQAVYFSSLNIDQRECFDRQLADLNESAQIRSDLIERESGAEKDWQLVLADSAKQLQDDPTGELEPAKQKQFQRDLVRELLEYSKVIEEIEKEREEHPLPEYEVGECST